MHSVLVIAETPISKKELPAWQDFLADTTGRLAKIEKIQTLAESTWLIPLENPNGLLALADIVQTATQYQFPYRVLFFEQAPSFTCLLARQD